MPEGVGYGPQFTASTGLTFNYIGKSVYAYSGVVVIANSEIALIDTRSEGDVIKVRWQWNYTTTGDAVTTDDYTFFFYLNDIKLTAVVSSVSDRFKENANYLEFIIPPYTALKITAINKTGSTNHNCYATITGKIV